MVTQEDVDNSEARAKSAEYKHNMNWADKIGQPRYKVKYKYSVEKKMSKRKYADDLREEFNNQ